MSNRNHQKSNFTQDGKPVFAARLVPHRSLSRGGFVIVMLFVTVSCLLSGLVFLFAGAWPVMAFMGLDVALVWLAFTLNYRAARTSEEIAVWPHGLLVRQISPAGRILEHHFNPFSTRFQVSRHEEIGITRMHLQERNRGLDIGSFLNPPDRESFAVAFGRALASVKSR